MRPSPTSHLVLLLALPWAVETAPAAAQKPPPPGVQTTVYRREVFRYPRGGRPDPFRSLLTAEELGYRIEDMQLTGIIYSPDARNSVAVLTEPVSKQRFRLKVGQRIGGITIAAIAPRRVEVVVNEFGVIRRETLVLRRPAVAPADEQEQPASPPPPPNQAGPRARGAQPQKGSGT